MKITNKNISNQIKSSPKKQIQRTTTLILLITGMSLQLQSASDWDTNGNNKKWGDAGNWTCGVPDATGAVANIGDTGGGDKNIKVSDNDYTVGIINIDDDNNRTIKDGGSGKKLKMDDSDGEANININTTNGNGSHTFDVELDVDDDLRITQNSSGVLTFNMPVKAGSSSDKITLDGTGEVLLSGTHTFETGTVVIESGTLTMGKDEAIKDGTSLELAGGTLDMNGFDLNDGGKEHLNTLTLSSSSTLDMGDSSTSKISFKDSSGVSWDSSATLTVTSFDELVDKIRFSDNSSGLSSSHLSQIVFSNPVGYAAGIYSASIDANGYLTIGTAVPETSTYVSIGALILIAGVFEYRRRRNSNA